MHKDLFFVPKTCCLFYLFCICYLFYSCFIGLKTANTVGFTFFGLLSNFKGVHIDFIYVFLVKFFGYVVCIICYLFKRDKEV